MVTGEFDVNILEDLLKQGYSGTELLERFKKIRGQVPAAMSEMLEDLMRESGGKTYTVEEVFGDDQHD